MSFRHWAALLLVVVCVLAGASGTPAQGGGLFIDATGPVAAALDQSARTDRTRLRSRTVRIDLPQLGTRGEPLSPGTTLQLNLFDDATYTAVLDRIDTTANGFVWVGHLRGVAMSTVTLATQDGVMSGSVFTPDATYAIGVAGGGLHSVAQIDQSEFPADAEPLEPAEAPIAAAADTIVTAQLDDASAIDVMVVYTPAAAAAAGGTAAIEAMIANAVSVTNTAYGNSGVTQRLRLVHAELVAYTESGSLDTDLRNVTSGVGALSGVAALRNTYQADIVSLFTQTPNSSVCGVGW